MEERRFAKIKLVSDGTALNTFVLDEHGKPIDWITKIVFEVDASNHFATLHLTIEGVPAEITGDVVEQTSKIKLRSIAEKG